jgi:lysophospholipase L1-like esterase
MNGFFKVIVLSSLGVIFSAGSSYSSERHSLDSCPAKPWQSKFSRFDRLIQIPSELQFCGKASPADWAHVSQLFASVPYELNSPPRAARFAPLVPSAGHDAEKGDQVRPRTGGQLYVQRVAALQTGQLYSYIRPNTFLNLWQAAWQQPTYQQWQVLLAREAELMADQQGNRSLTVLVGDSLYLWLPQEHLASDRLWLNQSISGETTSHILRRLDYFANVRPGVVYVMAGVNDLKDGLDPMVVVSNVELIAQRLRVQHPQARIVVLSILPTRLPPIPTTTVQWVNQRIAHAVRRRGVEFVDLQSVFMDNQGLLKVELTTDGIHLSPQGYRLLAGHLNSP